MRHGLTFVFLVVLAGSCAGSGSTGSPGAGGSGGGGSGAAGTGAAGTGAAGAVGTGAAGVAGSGAAGMAAGGASGSAGTGGGGASGGQGAAGTGGGAGAGGGQGGAGTGGTTDGGTSTDGGATPAVASAGCGKGGRPPNGVVTVANDHIYNFPASYDGTKPMPLVIALHGANNSNTILQTLSNGSRLETNFVRAFPKSTGSAWSFMNGTGPDAMRITAIYNELLASYCIDTNRVFLMGHSSGAQMSVQMICVPGGDKRWKAVAPVAASKYCNTLTPIPVMYIQGMMDAMRGNGDGANVVAVFTASNMCTTATQPYTKVPNPACNSTTDQKPVNAGCVSYQGCVQPTVWCSHNDNGYNLAEGRQHGWPCFASNAMADWFLGLP